MNTNTRQMTQHAIILVELQIKFPSVVFVYFITPAVIKFIINVDF